MKDQRGRCCCCATQSLQVARILSPLFDISGGSRFRKALGMWPEKRFRVTLDVLASVCCIGRPLSNTSANLWWLQHYFHWPWCNTSLTCRCSRPFAPTKAQVHLQPSRHSRKWWSPGLSTREFDCTLFKVLSVDQKCVMLLFSRYTSCCVQRLFIMAPSSLHASPALFSWWACCSE